MATRGGATRIASWKVSSTRSETCVSGLQGGCQPGRGGCWARNAASPRAGTGESRFRNSCRTRLMHFRARLAGFRSPLTCDALYVANEGKPFEGSGVRALLYTHLSDKTGNEIGRFGLGFKSISGISDGPQIFSRSVSFEFNP